MRILFIFTLILSAFSIQINAQKKGDDKPGKDFIINNSYDTIWGKFTGNMTPASASLRITFIENTKGTKHVYKPYDIKSWHPDGLGYYFESKEYRPKGMRAEEQGYGVFMKCFTPYEGDVRYYEYYNTDGQEGYYQSFLVRRGVMVEVKFEKFYAQLAEYFADNPELVEKLKAKKFKKTELAKIVDEYNLGSNRKA